MSGVGQHMIDRVAKMQAEVNAEIQYVIKNGGVNELDAWREVRSKIEDAMQIAVDYNDEWG